MSRVFRMKFVPTIEESGQEVQKSNSQLYEKYRQEIFKKFLKYKIIGTGWGNKDLKAGMDDKIIQSIKETNSELSVFRAMCSITSGDLIWIIFKSNYYLFRVSKNMVGSEWNEPELAKDKEWLISKDISHYFKGEWLKIGDSVNVPGIVVNSMGIGPTIMELKTSTSLTQFVWNKYSKKNTYNIEKLTKNQIWDLLTDRQVEGLVLTYIQFKYDCMVNTETLKHSTAKYECELVGKDEKYYYPQVKTGKTGDEQLVKTFYNEIKDINKNAISIIFFENENYGTFNGDNLVTISKDELWKFMMAHKSYLSHSVINALELYEEI